LSLKILIAGQGIAGAVLANTLRAAGVIVCIADTTPFVSSSALAAGVINPVTGKRYAKSWGFDLFFPFAQQFYTQLAQQAGEQIWYDFPIIRLLGSHLESNEWNLRAARPEFEGLMGVAEDAIDWKGLISADFTCGLLHRAARVDFEVVLRFTRTLFSATGQWLPEYIAPDQTDSWLNSFDRIIFCEGHKGASNPFFPGIPWQCAKGERLLIALDDEREIRHMLKKHIMIVPVGPNKYWVGANYIWDFEDSAPTPGGLQFLTDELDQTLLCGYRILAHGAAVRPVVKDRRPIIGWSKEDPRIGIFNGTGSKGALLAPYWADHFTGHICGETAINTEVEVGRF
jgi:glycine/D-amino acid oxidase-like deaminating enzyme